VNAETPVRASADVARLLAGRVCLVTGASRGIGRVLAESLAGAGAKVVLVARSEADLAEVADMIGGAGRDAGFAAADLTEASGAQHAVAAAIDRFGRLDVAVLNAGVLAYSSAYDLSPDEWDFMLDGNLKSVFLSAQAAGRQMRAQGGGGTIVAISSNLASVAYPQFAAYAAAKAGVSQLVKALALEWAADGIRVNAVAPAACVTDMNRSVFEEPAYRDAVVGKIPLGRLLEPDDLVGPVAFLASPAASMITGQTLLVDGGWTVQ
jgi:NAD(P)-dependent dehydrogenase (short-subunit alcohol dehydrogenase family)